MSGAAGAFLAHARPPLADQPAADIALGTGAWPACRADNQCATGNPLGPIAGEEGAVGRPVLARAYREISPVGGYCYGWGDTVGSEQAFAGIPLRRRGSRRFDIKQPAVTPAGDRVAALKIAGRAEDHIGHALDRLAASLVQCVVQGVDFGAHSRRCRQLPKARHGKRGQQSRKPKRKQEVEYSEAGLAAGSKPSHAVSLRILGSRSSHRIEPKQPDYGNRIENYSRLWSALLYSMYPGRGSSSVNRESLRHKLAARQVKPTSQRLAVAAVLFERPQHLSADEIRAELANRGARVSKATVYNTLRLFSDRGLVRELIVDPDRIFYDTTTRPHHHFYNVDTGELHDIAPADVAVNHRAATPAGTEELGVEVLIRVRQRA